MKLYTRTGDDGSTSLIGGRVGKDDAQVEAYGTIDELNAFTGAARAAALAEPAMRRLADMLEEIQHELFDCGSDLSYAAPRPEQLKTNEEMAARLERWIDELDGECPPLRRFVLPGGTPLAAALHVCRTVCRRAERRVVTLAGERAVHPPVQAYLNRLSDYYFAAARAANFRAGQPDAEYARGADVFRGDR
ncbi:ATP:Cob(I)alamin adenosyltransferase [Paenibacillus pasadenensis]|uniref:Corrinoid adenosyltransferase n=1 Tax=Paenibacillus pasadenensis TaxID=217090 RepID=A0A2N5N453_9BACL|nr:cob(I)yrinic acid a,c-diamide adenosyltransferase [Paenibacillus pasadenensis]PLT45100.1 ATP:Cob(I)alamin adenosyltransferase [Paenibacillus pasadenensis]